MTVLLFVALILFAVAGIGLAVPSTQRSIWVALIAFGLAAVDGAALWPHLGGLH